MSDQKSKNKKDMYGRIPPPMHNIGVFWKVLFRWKGSVYKLLYFDLIIYMAAYYLIRIIYQFVLEDNEKKYFRDIVKYCKSYSSFFPISFVLGFFVSFIMTRWWNQYTTIPRPQGVALFVSSTVHGHDEVGKALRRTIIRYVNLTITMILRKLSPQVQKRFPFQSNLVDAGLLNENELIIFEEMDETYPGNSSWNLPLVWAATIVAKARQIGRINDELHVKSILEELNKIRVQCAFLIYYNTVHLSSVYSQVVIIACYSYFLAALFGSQTLDIDHEYEVIDFGYLPIFLILQFIFYIGWLKVAEQLVNPFGDDDDDFDVCSIIDSNLLMSYLIVDKMHDEHPIILKDIYWGEIPCTLQDLTRKSKESSLNSLRVPGSASKPRAAFEAKKINIHDIPEFHHNYQSLLIDPELIARRRRASQANTDLQEIQNHLFKNDVH